MKTLRLLPARACVLSLLGLLAVPVFSQTAAPEQRAVASDSQSTKKWSVYWGWNRAGYSNSDIHFSGRDHDFTLRSVYATDMPTPANWDGISRFYLNPGAITIPQTNLRVGYQWDTGTAIALNLDHMKYVMKQNQTVAIDGQINGVAQSGGKMLTADFLTFEHTDGLNVLSIEIEKQRSLDLFGPSMHAKAFVVAGVGLVMPKSNVSMGMVGRARNDEFHVAGYSAGVGAGLEVDVWKDVFVRTAYKMGVVELPDVVTSSEGDKASHHFNYNELLIAVGMRF
jgi:opacity protein-like surface antigen